MENLINKIINGDCLDILPTIKDKSIDMILCDLPYGTTSCAWDTIIPFEPLWKEYKRIIKGDGAIVLTSQQPFTSALIMSNPKWFKYCWVWDKHIPRLFQTAKYRPMSRHEDICVFGLGKIKYNPQMIKRDKPVKYKNYGSSPTISTDLKDTKTSRLSEYRNPDTIIEGLWEANAGKFHPTQKPVKLFEYLIKTYTNEGDLILDNCLGSGTTALAAKNTNRKYIGIEINKEYCEIAEQRLKDLIT